MKALARILVPRTLLMGPTLLVVLVFSVWAALLIGLVFSGNKVRGLSLMVATLLPVALYASRNPRLLLLMCAVGTSVLGLSFNVNFRPHIGGAASYSIAVVDAFLLPLIIFMIRDHVRGWRTGIRISAVSYWWLGLMALGVGSLITGPFRQFAAMELLSMLKCWILFLVIVNECVRERHFERVMVALALAIAFNILVAMAQFALKRTLGLQALGEAADAAVLGANLGVYGGESNVYRVSGLLGHPNLFSAFLAMLLPIYIGLMFAGYSARVRALLGALSLTGLACLLLTLSRTGWAAYAVSILLLLTFLYAHPWLADRERGLKAGIVAALALATIVAAPIILQRIYASDSGALDSRYEMMGVAWKMVQAKPIFGFGLNTFSYQMFDYAPYSVGRMQEIYGPVPTVVHNIYMLVWAEQGTVGLLLFLGLNAHLIWVAWRNTRYRLSRTVLLLNIGAIGALLALMVDGLGSFYMRVPGPARIFWLLAGLIVASKYWNEANARLRAAGPTSIGMRGSTPSPNTSSLRRS
jgi:O-antigen ligase